MTIRVQDGLILGVLLTVVFLESGCLFAQLPESNPKYRSMLAQERASSAPRETEETMIKPGIRQFLSNVARIFTTRSNLLYLGGGAGLTSLVRPFDDDLSDALKDANPDRFELKFLEKFGSLLVVSGTSLAVHLLGRATKKAYLANTGLYAFEAFLTAQFFTFLPKQLVQRRRPDGSDDLSFPSGHASGMFAVAAVLDKRYGYKVAIPSYLVSGIVGFSRVRRLKHFPSDVIAGTTIGVIVGRSFVSPEHRRRSFSLYPYFDSERSAIAVRYSF